MKVYFYIGDRDLEYLNKILKDSNNLERALHISFNSFKNSAMVSINYDNFVHLCDSGAFIKK